MDCNPAVCLLSGYHNTCKLTASNTILYLTPAASNRRSAHEFHGCAASEFDREPGCKTHRHPGDEFPRCPGGRGRCDRVGSG